EHLHGFLGVGLSTPEQGNHFSRVRAFYHWATHVLNAPEFEPRIATQLKSIRAVGNKKGEAVESWAPTKGPLTREEVHLLLRAIYDGVGSRQERLTTLVLLE